VGKRFCAPVQTGLGAHSLLYNGYQVSFLEVNWLAHAHQPPSIAEVKERV